MVGKGRIELPQLAPKASVLPLDDSPVRRSCVTIRWQLAHSRSHFSISSWTSFIECSPANPRLNDFTVPGRWSKSIAHEGNRPPHLRHGLSFAAAKKARITSRSAFCLTVLLALYFALFLW